MCYCFLLNFYACITSTPAPYKLICKKAILMNVPTAIWYMNNLVTILHIFFFFNFGRQNWGWVYLSSKSRWLCNWKIKRQLWQPLRSRQNPSILKINCLKGALKITIKISICSPISSFGQKGSFKYIYLAKKDQDIPRFVFFLIISRFFQADCPTWSKMVGVVFCKRLFLKPRLK